MRGNQQGLISFSPNKHRRESRWPAIEDQIAPAVTLTIIDLSAASSAGAGAGLSQPRPATLTRAGYGSLLLRDREHPPDRRPEQP